MKLQRKFAIASLVLFIICVISEAVFAASANTIAGYFGGDVSLGYNFPRSVCISQFLLPLLAVSVILLILNKKPKAAFFTALPVTIFSYLILYALETVELMLIQYDNLERDVVMKLIFIQRVVWFFAEQSALLCLISSAVKFIDRFKAATLGIVFSVLFIILLLFMGFTDGSVARLEVFLLFAIFSVLFIVADVLLFNALKSATRPLVIPHYIGVLIIPVLNLADILYDYDNSIGVDFILPLLLLGGAFTSAAVIKGEINEKEKQNP